MIKAEWCKGMSTYDWELLPSIHVSFGGGLGIALQWLCFYVGVEIWRNK